jgi:hypothetical protein
LSVIINNPNLGSGSYYIYNDKDLLFVKEVDINNKKVKRSLDKLSDRLYPIESETGLEYSLNLIMKDFEDRCKSINIAMPNGEIYEYIYIVLYKDGFAHFVRLDTENGGTKGYTVGGSFICNRSSSSIDLTPKYYTLKSNGSISEETFSRDQIHSIHKSYTESRLSGGD